MQTKPKKKATKRKMPSSVMRDPKTGRFVSMKKDVNYVQRRGSRVTQRSPYSRSPEK